MPDVAIYSHGRRSIGTSQGSYLIPPGVTIYFFVKDEVAFRTSWGTYLLEQLCQAHPDLNAVRQFAVEVKREYETIPNYELYPDPNGWKYPAGAYQVGLDCQNNPPLVPIMHHIHISDLIGGQSSGGVLGNNFYYLACRWKPQVGAVWRVAPSEFVPGNIPNGMSREIGARFEAISGVKPSVVKTRDAYLRVITG